MFLLKWVSFLILVFLLLALDLGVLNKKVHEISTKEALKWTILWISIALVFAGAIYVLYSGNYLSVAEGVEKYACFGDDGNLLLDKDGNVLAACTQCQADGMTAANCFRSNTAAIATMDYLSGYLIEKALSLDNIAVMSMIFASFAIPLKFQHRVLFWGILGALIMRGFMIGVGAAAVAQYHWVLWIFGALLFVVAFKSTFGDEDEEDDPQNKPLTKFLKKHFPYTEKIEGMHFLAKLDGKTVITPLLITLVVVEVSDVIFAVDSIPAIFGITTDPFIVFTSNIFAILGLRSLYFVLASILEKFAYLKYSVFVILLFVSVKLLVPAGYAIVNWIGDTNYKAFELPDWSSLAVVVGSIAVGIIVSLALGKTGGDGDKSDNAKSDESSDDKKIDEAKSDEAKSDASDDAKPAEAT